MTPEDVRRRAPRERFEIVRVLGSGGMGVVYEAVDRERRTRVALKTLRSLDAEARIRFKTEFRALQDIHHPNLVSLGELIEEPGRLFFTMELVRGVHFIEYVRPREAATRPLRAAPGEGGRAAPSGSALRARQAAWLLRDGEAFDEARLRSTLGQLVRGLSALHAAQKVHRDIKPSNVLVDEDGRVVILDFGLIADLDQPERELSVVGTAHFMAPEQAAALPVGPEADWYSVGAMLYVALTGYYPFQLAPEVTLDFKQQVEPEPPSKLAPGLPPDLEALCMDLLRIAPEERPTAEEVRRRLRLDEPPPQEAPATSRRSGFVGRRRELAALESALGLAQMGRAVAVLVEGESGMGKTALVRRFLRQIEGEALVLAGRCYARESVPYKAVDELIDALSRHLAALPDAEVRALLPPSAALIGGVFPVLRKVPAVAELERPAGEAHDPHATRALVFAALRELFRRLAAQKALVLAIDDMQWADADGIALLVELLRPPEAPRLLLVATLRTGSGVSPRGTSPRRALPEGVVRYLTLERMPGEEAEELVTMLLQRAGRGPGGGRAPAIDVDGLIHEADGHPFFLDVLVRHRLEQAESALATRLDDVLWARVQQLDAAPRRLLELVAIAGGPLSLRLAGEVVMAGASELTRQAAALAAANLARVGRTAAGEVIEAYHDRVRETVLGRLDRASRRGWHGRLALALEATGHAELERLAVHWREAGDAETAAGYAARAADQAAGALAFDRAAELYRSALELFPRDGAVGRSLRARLGDALANAGRGAEAARAYLAARAGSPPAEALDLERRAAENLLRSGYIDEGLASLHDVLAAIDMAVPRTPARALASLLFRRAELRMRGLAFEERGEALVAPEELARIDICWSSALGLAMVDPIRGAYFQTRNLLLALEAGEPYRVARALSLEVPFVATVGGVSQARVAELLRAAEPIAERTGNPHATGLVRAVAGVSDFLMGRWRKALTALDEAEVIFRERCTNTAWERDAMLSFSAWSLFHLGELEELGRRLPRYLEEAEQRGDRLLSINLRTYVANAFWLVRDDPAEAHRQAAEAIRRWSSDGFHLQHMYDLVARTQTALYEGEGALAHLRLVEGWAGLQSSLSLRIQLVRVTLADLRARAAIASARGSADRGTLLRLAREAARALEAEGMSWVDPMAARVRAGIAAVERDFDGAVVALDKAIRGFTAVDMKLCAAAARYRYGEIIGGDRGDTIAREAERWMRAQGVIAPERLVAMLMPGFG